ncbi:MAG: DUF3482 domain-containing protein, partial [Sulfurovaceae bacterium]|nr:DUF3482 domain-containing protein [Sulfurovaceae bacterium]
GIDLAFGGGTMFLASLIGGAVGGVGAMIGFDNLYDVKVMGQKMGKRELSIGPMQNLNFPYVLLGRALYYTYTISNRSHAVRDNLELKSDEFFGEQIFDANRRKKLEIMHNKLRKEEKVFPPILEEYRGVILESFKLI